MDVALSAEASAYPQSEADFACDEFVELSVSAGMAVVELVKGSRKKPDPRTYIGKGKIDEIKLLLKDHEVDVVLFGQRLSPSQERNLERELEVRVLDRSSLILDIFAQRARSFEGKLQVELAQLTHLSTRLVRGWTHLERQKGGIGLRGPGETQLETDRRLLNDRVKTLKQRLVKVRRQRSQGRSQRSKSGTPTVALVGYTNAGKSTLFNQLTDANVFAADQLFATLDPTMRRMALPGGNNAVLADTVGFINDLPHELVAAFLSTLTETREADLLLHVVDACDDLRENRREQVNAILEEIGASHVPQLMVFNKVDKTEFAAHIEHDPEGLPAAAWVSAISGAGIDGLRAAISQVVSRTRSIGWLNLLPSHGRLRAQLFEADAVREEVINDDGGLKLYIDMDAIDFTRLVREHDLTDRFTPDSIEPTTALQ
ncbi:MAG: ribosome rescue GTPase HflX [Granulosicoccaceae bacterium]